MSLLAKRSEIKEDKSNIITLGAIAAEAKKKNPSVVNATIGMYYDEEGTLVTFQSVNEALNLLTNEEKYAYSSTPGNPSFHEALKHWVFRDQYDYILSRMHCSVMATPGGSGAISNTFSNYLNENDKVLLPSYMWGNYKQFAYEGFASSVTYELFNENGGFNLDDCYQQMQMLKASQHRVLLVVNDPCQNPTGYCMTRNEWISLIRMINEISADGTPFVLLYDMAYIDYDYRGMLETRKNITLFTELNDNVLVVLAFSGSKTLGVYGLRIGAQIALCKQENSIKEFFQANKFSSRAKWSTTTNLGMNLTTKIFTDARLRQQFEQELKTARELLVKRANTFIAEAKKVNLTTLPFQCGYFVSIPCANPMEVYEKLAKMNIYIIPLANVLRVTISAISVQDCARLPKLIKECL